MIANEQAIIMGEGGNTFKDDDIESIADSDDGAAEVAQLLGWGNGPPGSPIRPSHIPVDEGLLDLW